MKELTEDLKAEKARACRVLGMGTVGKSWWAFGLKYLCEDVWSNLLRVNLESISRMILLSMLLSGSSLRSKIHSGRTWEEVPRGGSKLHPQNPNTETWCLWDVCFEKQFQLAYVYFSSKNLFKSGTFGEISKDCSVRSGQSWDLRFQKILKWELGIYLFIPTYWLLLLSLVSSLLSASR